MNACTKILILLFGCTSIVSAQTIILSAGGVTAGGGSASGATIGMRSSAGIPAMDKSSGGGGGLFMAGGIIPVQGVFTGTTSAISSEVEATWNMVAVPAITESFVKDTLFPFATSEAFAYQNGYRQRDTLQLGAGYWLKYGLNTAVKFLGTAVIKDTFAVADKWNMIGSVSFPVPVSNVTPLDPTSLVTAFYGYTSSAGYAPADTLMPGKAYWVKVQNAGQIIINSNATLLSGSSSGSNAITMMKSAHRSEVTQSYSTLEITDANGKSRTLYFSTIPSDIDVSAFELPPVAPAGVMDVRYENNLNISSSQNQKETSVGLTISSATYPITIEWNNKDTEGSARLMVGDDEIIMSGSGKTHIAHRTSHIRLALSPSSGKQLPTVFALQQNYPNPFNPSTVIRYQLPVAGKVTLEVYSILGQRVATLIDEQQEAGFKLFEWNASAIPSGVYFYRLSASDGKMTFADVKKMILVR